MSITSKNTSVNQLPAIALLVACRYGWRVGSKNLDIGAGRFEQLTEYLSHEGVQSFPYDPYNRTAEENELALASGPYDTVTVSNVLNVVQDHQDRKKIIEMAKSMVSRNGMVFFTVYEGDKSGVGKETSKGWQENRSTASYKDELLMVFPVVFRFGKVFVARWEDCGETGDESYSGL